MKEVTLVAQADRLMVTLWQEKVPWLTVVQVKKEEIYGGIQRARTAVWVTFGIGAILISVAILLTTGNLVGRLESKGQSLRLLDCQLRRTSYLASSMELSMGFLAEIKDIFSNIDISVQWLARAPSRQK